MNQTKFLKFNTAGELMPADATDHVYVRHAESGLEFPARLLPEARFAETTKVAAACGLAGGGWRMPTPQEQALTIDYDRYGPACDTSVFLDVPEFGGMWTSKVDASDPESNAWVAVLHYGSIRRYLQNDKFWVRLVRGPVSPGQ